MVEDTTKTVQHMAIFSRPFARPEVLGCALQHLGCSESDYFGMHADRFGHNLSDPARHQVNMMANEWCGCVLLSILHDFRKAGGTARELEPALDLAGPSSGRAAAGGTVSRRVDARSQDSFAQAFVLPPSWEIEFRPIV